MNKFIGTGNICKDIELKTTQSGKPVIQNSIGIRNTYKNKNGEYGTEFVNIVVWNQTAEFLKKYATKGTKIAIEGRLTNRSYEKQDGTKAYITEVICETVELLCSTKKEETITEVKQEAETKQSDPFAEFGKEVEITDDMLPF